MDPAVSGIVGSILGAVVGGGIAFLSGVKFIGLNQRIEASKKLRSELLLIANKIDPSGETSFKSLDDEAVSKLDQHNFLAYELRYHLSGSKLNDFSNAWQDYYKYVNNIRVHGRTNGRSGKCYQEYNKQFYDLINEVLKYTLITKSIRSFFVHEVFNKIS